MRIIKTNKNLIEIEWRAPDWSGFTDGDEIIATADWSNLLEAALNNDEMTVTILMQTATIQELNNTLETLNKVYKVCNNPNSTLHKEHTYVAQVYIAPETILATRKRILAHLSDIQMRGGITLSESDISDLKRATLQSLEASIQRVNSIHELMQIYHANIDSFKLNYRRNPTFDFFRNKIRGEKYTQSKINFIKSCQRKAGQLINISTADNQLMSSLFSEMHLSRGVSDHYYPRPPVNGIRYI